MRSSTRRSRASIPVEQLWQDYWDTGDQQAYSDLIMYYRPLLHRIAKKLGSSIPVSIEYLESDGILGLMDAIQKFDSSKGVKFEGYAITRIRGSIIDGVRSRDDIPRSVRAKESKVNFGIECLSQKLGRIPTSDELSQLTGLSVSEVDDCIRGAGEVAYYDAEDMASELADRVTTNPGDLVDLNALRQILVNSFKKLGHREQILFALYYNHGLPLSDIGIIFGITEARASQIHIKAIRDLYSKVLT